jgi:hypothetical protein
MSANTIRNSNDNPDTNHHQSLRRQSILFSSNPNSDCLPIDCILVYDRTDSNKDIDTGSNYDNQRKKNKKLSERRRKFEEYLVKKQGLILNRVVSKINILKNFLFLFFLLNRNQIQRKLVLLKFIHHLIFFY